ncbi:hypothetical protein Tco_1420309 [Tanacetum coccineum]
MVLVCRSCLLVPIPLPDDPYVAVSQAQLVDTDTESNLEEAPSDVEELQSVGSRVPLMGEEFKAFEPSVRAQPAMSPSLSASMTKAMALLDLAFRKRYRSSYETPSSSSSLALPIRKRYRGTSELILDTDTEGDEIGDKDTDEDGEDESLDADDERERLDDEDHSLDYEDRSLDDEDCGLDDEDRGLDDEGLGLEEEEATPEGQQQAVLVVDTSASEPLDPEDDRVYTDISVYQPVAPVQTLLSLEWSSGSFPVSLSSLVVTSPIASPVATSTTTISVDEDRFLERHVLTLEAWAGHVDTGLADTSRDRYDDHRLIHDMLVQQAGMQREL